MTITMETLHDGGTLICYLIVAGGIVLNLIQVAFDVKGMRARDVWVSGWLMLYGTVLLFLLATSPTL